MISSRLGIVLVTAVVMYFIAILLLLKKRAISLKYTLLWLVAGIVLGIMVIWPKSLELFVSSLGIISNMNGLFIMSIAFVVIILMSLTSIVSKQTDKIKNLTQSIAEMEKRIRELENYE